MVYSTPKENRTDSDIKEKKYTNRTNNRQWEDIPQENKNKVIEEKEVDSDGFEVVNKETSKKSSSNKNFENRNYDNNKNHRRSSKDKKDFKKEDKTLVKPKFTSTEKVSTISSSVKYF